MDIINTLKSKIQESRENLKALSEGMEILSKIDVAAKWMIEALKQGHKILICGNGGSAADAQHFAAEMIGRFYTDRRPLPALSLATDTSILTCVANDYSYEEVFSRQVTALGEKGDILFGISTSGSSKNVLKAFEAGLTKGMKTVLLSGAKEKEIAEKSDLTICVPTSDTPRIQELHLFIEHSLCEVIEKAFVDEK